VYAVKPSALRGLEGLAAMLGSWPTNVDPDDWNG
jgi:hypothetical protein